MIVFLLVLKNISANQNSLNQSANSSSSNTLSEKQNISTSTSKVVKYTKNSAFVFVANYENSIQNLNTEDLINYKIFALNSTYLQRFCKEDKLLICSKLTFLSNIEEIFEVLKSSETNIALLDIFDSDFRFKQLNYNSQNIFMDHNSYELKISFETDDNTIKSFDPSSKKTIAHTGSFIPARGVMLWTKRFFGGDLGGMTRSFEEKFQKFDILSATQEISLDKDGIFCDSCMNFVGSEKEVEQMLVPLGIDLVTMAANHVMDGGIGVMGKTIELIEQKGIKVVGASTINNIDALTPKLVEKNGLKIAYIAFNDTPGLSQWADESSGGAANFTDWVVENGVTVKYEPNLERIKNTVSKAKELKPDLIIALPHWGGVEYERIPTDYVKNLANLLVSEGVDAILGDHPHWVQQIEWLRNENGSYSGAKNIPVVYSVGNFVFDQMWSEDTRIGITAELVILNNKIIGLDTHPHYLELYTKGTVSPVLESETLYKKIRNSIFESSVL